MNYETLERRVAELERKVGKLLDAPDPGYEPSVGETVRFWFGRERKGTGTRPVRVTGEVLDVHEANRQGRVARIRFQEPKNMDLITRNVRLKQIIGPAT